MPRWFFMPSIRVVFTMGKQIKPYLFSAILSYFIFFLLRETGVLGPPMIVLLDGEQLQNAFSPPEVTRTMTANNAGLHSTTTHALRGSREQYQQQNYPMYETQPKSSLYDFFPANTKTSANSFVSSEGVGDTQSNNFLSTLTSSRTATGYQFSALQSATTTPDYFSKNHYSAVNVLAQNGNAFVEGTSAPQAKRGNNAVETPLHHDTNVAGFSASSYVAPQNELQRNVGTELSKSDSASALLRNDPEATIPVLSNNLRHEVQKDTPQFPSNPTDLQGETSVLVASYASVAAEASRPQSPEEVTGSATAVSPLPAAAAAAAAAATTTTTTTTTGSTMHNAVQPENETAVSSPSTSLTSSSSSSSTQSSPSKPIMHTFFEYIPLNVRGTQMTDEADHLLLQEWISSWEAAGWDTKILSLADAKQHADYDMFAAQLQLIPLMGEDGLGNNVFYNQLCFLRWLAMAAAGGGYMSDYDVFPLTRVPTNLIDPHGNFTVHAAVQGSRLRAGIPCLMSGSASEWSRMAHAIVQNGLAVAQTNSSITMWSDMMALIDMRKQGAYDVQDVVVEGQDVLVAPALQDAPLSDDAYCRITRGKMAIHFSHQAIARGHLLPGETIQHRALIARRFFMERLQHHPQPCSPT